MATSRASCQAPEGAAASRPCDGAAAAAAVGDARALFGLRLVVGDGDRGRAAPSFVGSGSFPATLWSSLPNFM